MSLYTRPPCLRNQSLRSTKTSTETVEGLIHQVGVEEIFGVKRVDILYPLFSRTEHPTNTPNLPYLRTFNELPHIL